MRFRVKIQQIWKSSHLTPLDSADFSFTLVKASKMYLYTMKHSFFNVIDLHKVESKLCTIFPAVLSNYTLASTEDKNTWHFQGQKAHLSPLQTAAKIILHPLQVSLSCLQQNLSISVMGHNFRSTAAPFDTHEVE